MKEFMKEQKYIAYISSYTHGKSKGIMICDVEAEKGRLIPRSETAPLPPRGHIISSICEGRQVVKVFPGGGTAGFPMDFKIHRKT